MGTTASDGASPAGTVIAGRYELVAPLGTGGMAQVWSATDRLLSRSVAVKILHRHLADDPSFVQRFRREAVSAARLVHPNIVAVYDTVSTDDCEAIVMELVDGTTLRQVLDGDGPLPSEEVRRLGIEVAGALDCAHRNGIVHRDIKPANILLTADGSVRLTDFGIAKADEDPDLTVAGTLVGTAAYLAPEQVGTGRIDQRTDLYSLSIVLYEAVSGATPFRGDSPAATALARLHHEPTPLSEMLDGRAVDDALCRNIMRNLALEPERRFQSALDFGTALAESGRGRRPSRREAVAAVRRDTPVTATPARTPARRRSLVGRVLLALMILGPLGLMAALAVDDPGGTTDDTTPETPTPTVGAVAIVGATTTDPLGDNREENSAAAPRVFDDDPTSAWSTEAYQSQTMEPKPGVGLVLELATSRQLTSLRLTGSVGWKGAVYVTDDDPTSLDGAPTGRGTPVDAAASPTTVDLDGATGRYVIVWITDLGPSSGRHKVTISDAALTGPTG